MNDVRARLQARLDELNSRAGRIDAHRRAPLSPDSEEQALGAQGEEVVDALDEATLAEMRAVRQALDRMAAGTWGLCEVCGEPIAERRLEALPTTARCLDHA
jgi:RNA polymerase-binding transcription factor DksA